MNIQPKTPTEEIRWQAILNGATEIDMVLPIGLLRQAVCQSDAEARAAVLRDISAVVSVCKRYNVVSKVSSSIGYRVMFNIA